MVPLTQSTSTSFSISWSALTCSNQMLRFLVRELNCYATPTMSSPTRLHLLTGYLIDTKKLNEFTLTLPHTKMHPGETFQGDCIRAFRLGYEEIQILDQVFCPKSCYSSLERVVTPPTVRLFIPTSKAYKPAGTHLST